MSVTFPYHPCGASRRSTGAGTEVSGSDGNRRDPPVCRPRQLVRPTLRTRQREHRGRRRHLPASRWPAAGHRAGRGSHALLAARRNSWRDWSRDCPSSPVGRAIFPRDSRRCAPPSTGATTCSNRRSRGSLPDSASLRGGAALEAVEAVCADQDRRADRGGRSVRPRRVARQAEPARHRRDSNRRRACACWRRSANTRSSASRKAGERDTIAARHAARYLDLAERAARTIVRRRASRLARSAGAGARQLRVALEAFE